MPMTKMLPIRARRRHPATPIERRKPGQYPLASREEVRVLGRGTVRKLWRGKVRMKS